MNLFTKLRGLFAKREYHQAVDNLMAAMDEVQAEMTQTVTFVRSRKESDRRERAVPVPIDSRRVRAR